ncbi:hypothetical protein A0H81_05031 [Grifola frondosa]|uniref:Uncharacterized protein n=1 Tax=Grifola frondosa TaxID=5627 RepID=A0A1C7MEP5_GRIFR|nr:hypothetical protein A0H81_05031 [Grifola frondosa]
MHTANFSVQFDNFVINLDASASSNQFQQLLFQHTLANQINNHIVVLTAILQGQGVRGQWLDVDFITFTDGRSRTVELNHTFGIFGVFSVNQTDKSTAATVLPPWASGSSMSNNALQSSIPTNTAASSSTSGVPSASPSSPSSSKVPTILASLFGALIGLALVIGVIYYILHRIYEARRARERRFRHGQANDSSGRKDSGSGMVELVKGTFGGRAQGSQANLSGTLASNAYTQVARAYSPRDASLMSGVPDGAEREGAGTPSTSRALLSASPVAFRKGPKGDADSLRTDFLQV